MTLGNYIRRWDTGEAVVQAIAASGDCLLSHDVAVHAELFGETPEEYARAALRRFANLASHDDWLSMMARLDQAEDPGTAFLIMALRWSVRKDTIKDDECGRHVQGAAGRDVSP